jgi:RNA polymerase sigma factor (sigma-70 family)
VRLGRRLWDSYIRQTRESNRALASKRLSDAGKQGNWRRWHREKAIVALMPMVERLARDVRYMFAPHLDIRDLTQAGCVGLVKAAAVYNPSRGAHRYNDPIKDFEPLAYFYARGAIIDSQKRRTYREESHVSLQAIAEAHDGWLPPELDRDKGPSPEELAAKNQLEERLADAVASLPRTERRGLTAHLAGKSLVATSRKTGRSLTRTKEVLATAKEKVGLRVRGET